MSKLEPPFDRRKFLAVSGSSLGLLAAGCNPKPESQPEVKAPPVADISQKTPREIEELLELEYTEAEWNQLIGSWEDRLENLRAIRSFNHPNSLAPAQVFDPRLPGNRYTISDSLFRLNAKPRPLPDNSEDIAFAHLSDLAHWVQTQQITSVELTELYLDRIQIFGAHLECFITLTADLAREQARQADTEIKRGQHRGLLHGLPYGLKDLFDTKGTHTTWGAGPYRDRIPESDANIVQKLRDAGAVLLGKTSCGAIAYGDIWFAGVTRNPWDVREGSSGSSAGSASATAAGLVAFSIGTETLGSIISPSVRCGTTGLRPTFGRVGRTGGMTLCWSLDKIGPICRSVEDSAIVMQVINGYDAQDPGSIATEFDYDGNLDLSKLRVGYDPQHFDVADSSSLNHTALEAARVAGVQLKEISLPKADSRGLMIQLQVEAAAAFEELTQSDRDDELRWQTDRAWPNSWRQARLIPATDYIQADRLRRHFMHEMQTVFEEVDVIIGNNFAGRMLQITNYTGHPQLSLRLGFEEREIRPAFEETSVAEGEQGTFPVSIGLWGPLFGEGQMLALGRALEESLNVNSKRPDLDV